MTVTAATPLASPTQVRRLVESAGVLALDLETTGLDPRTDRIRLLSLANGNQGGALVLDCFEHDPRPLLPVLHGKILIAHNAAFDLGFLWQAGLHDLPETICTYLCSVVLDGTKQPPGHHSLAGCVSRYLGVELPKELQASDWSGPLSAEQLDYALRDARVLIPLWRKQLAELKRVSLVQTATVECLALPAFVWLRQSGVAFDRERWAVLNAQAQEKKEQAEKELAALAPKRSAPDLFGETEPWNWSSPQQVADVLRQFGFDVSTTCDAQLALIDHPVADLLRQHREAAQLVKMYGTDWPCSYHGGRLYPEWKQIGADTGRTSCSGPNCQQVPRAPGYKACFRAPEGRALVKADYSQLQMRIAARISGDAALLNVFQSGEDVHTATARRTLGKATVSKADRQIAKSQNFGLLFGMSAAGLRVYARTTYGVDFTEEEAQQHRAAFFAAYPGLARWHERTRRDRPKETRGRWGRRRVLHPFTDTERLNSPVQADEADGLKMALAYLWLDRASAPDAFPVLVVHDELVVDCDADQTERARAWLEAAMLDAMNPLLDPVPAAVDVAVRQSWGE